MESRPTIVQGGTLPVFRGRSKDRFLCSQCGNLLVEGYEPRSLIGIDIECFKCKTINTTAAWPDNEPLPHKLVTLGDKGRFLLKGTVDLRDDAAMSCDQEIERISARTSPRVRGDDKWELSSDSLELLETQLDVMTGGALKKTAARAKKAEEHRNVQLAQIKFPLAWGLSQLKKSLERGTIDLDGADGVALAYLHTLRDALFRWREHPRFPLVADMLCNNFHHAITAFTIASYLSDVGNNVGIADDRADTEKSPDLFINVGRSRSLSIEVKCSQAFFWPATEPSKDDIIRRLEKEVRGARDQILGGQAGGVVVVGGGFLSARFATSLEESVKDLAERHKLSTKIAAIAAVCFFRPNVEITKSEPRITSGGHVFVATNPRFPGPNPVATDGKEGAGGERHHRDP